MYSVLMIFTAISIIVIFIIVTLAQYLVGCLELYGNLGGGSIAIFQMGKLRLREFQWLSQLHRVGEW